MPDSKAVNQEPSLSLGDFAKILIARRVVLVRGAVAVGVFVFVAVFIGGRTYSSEFSLFPRINTVGTGVSALAGQLGVSMPGLDIAQSPNFYADLVRSRVILDEVVDSLIVLAESSLIVDTTLGITEVDTALRRVYIVHELERSISARVSLNSGVVHVRVRTGHPLSSQRIASLLEGIVARFNVKARQEQAAEELEFSLARLAIAHSELTKAEDMLRDFVLRNRRYEEGADTRLEANRLERAVALKHGVVASLEQAMEQARMDERRDTPTLTFVDHATAAVLPDRRHLLVKTLAAALAGLLTAVALILLTASDREIRIAREASPQSIWKSLVGDVFAPHRFVAQVLGWRRR